MKKLITLTIFLFLFLSFRSNADSLTIPIPDTSKITLTKVYNDVKSGITGLASALKVPATHVYKILVKQQVVYSIAYCIFPLIMITFLSISYKSALISKWGDSYSSDKENRWNKYATFTIITGVIGGIFIITTCIYINDIITGFINPEYGAIKDIMNFIR